MSARDDGILPLGVIGHLYAQAASQPGPIDALAFVRAVEQAVIEQLLRHGGEHQVPVTTYLAPDGETRWPAYSHEQRQQYAAVAVLKVSKQLSK